MILHRRPMHGWKPVPLRMWQPVRLKRDPRHEGEVCAIIDGVLRVKWANGWKSDHPDHDELEKAERQHPLDDIADAVGVS